MAKLVEVWADGSGVWHATVWGAGAGDAAGRRVARTAIVDEIASGEQTVRESFDEARKRVSAAVRIGRDFSVGGFSAVGWSEVAR